MSKDESITKGRKPKEALCMERVQEKAGGTHLVPAKAAVAAVLAARATEWHGAVLGRPELETAWIQRKAS